MHATKPDRPMQWTHEQFFLTTDLDRFDFDFVTRALHTTYWASDRPRPIVEKSFRNAIGFGLFDGAAQIGFARIVTDHLTFSWLCDVYVDPAYRGRGLATWMIECILSHPGIAPTRAILRTKDAHKLYEKFGFQREEFMRRMPTQ